ncbi:5' exonuclease Apollo [Dorcoceras hygrometricum]|uniref:5' exonuclease Apollo n=1 Tax=Dorcoceras hygrometricum TaxID=472368 RepID=A0A2Z7D7D8_9LAMI|nr:5' exonuclease Apollo [Dorcoceras hygrometricum]
MPIEMPKGLPFSVDTWTPSSKRKRHHFLTHAHKDHAQGFSAHATFPTYSTLFTRTLIRRYYPQVDESIFVGIETGQSLAVGDPDGDFTVTAFDANHCPGAVMFLFEGSFGNILHTGDCRLTPECLLNLPEKYLGKKGKKPLSPLDYVFLDCTFGQFPSNMPSRHAAIQQVINCIWKHPNARTVYLTCDLLGQEEILVQVSQTFGAKIYVDKIKSPECLKALELTVPEILSQDPSSRFQLFDGFHRLYERAKDKISEARNNFQHEPLIIRPSAQWYACDEGVSDTQSHKKAIFDQAVRDLYGVWHVCYTIHSSRDELEWALELLAPKWVVSTTPSCRAMELNYVKKHCQRAFDDSLWSLLDFSEVESLDSHGAGKSVGCSNLMERIPNRCVDAESKAVVISTLQRKRLSMSPPSKRPMLTLFGRARLCLQDSILQHELNEIVSVGSDSLERAATDEEQTSTQKVKVIEVKLQDPLDSNGMAERVANCEESKFTYAAVEDVRKQTAISSTGFSRSYDENLRRFYRTVHVPIPRPLPSLVKLMDANKKMKKRR